MGDQGFKRKLSSILSADVKGYSKLMGDDEEATVRTLKAYLSAKLSLPLLPLLFTAALWKIFKFGGIMIASRKLFLPEILHRNGRDSPNVLFSPHFIRSVSYGNHAYILGFFISLFFLMIFLVAEIYLLVFFNALCLLLWVVTISVHRKSHFLYAYLISSLITIANSIICVLTIGWQTGFQYYLIVQFVMIFSTDWPSKSYVKVSVISLYIATYIFLYLYSIYNAPFIDLDVTYLRVLYQMNIICISLILAHVAYINNNLSIRSEKKLGAEHQKTKLLLNQRNQLLKQLEQELFEASNYVRDLLPPPIKNGFIQTDWRFFPSSSLGGDAFGYHNVDEDHFAIYLVDISGHGVGAALLSASVINVLRSQSLPNTNFRDPEQVLQSLNHAFPSTANKDMFFTLWYGVYNPCRRELIYASAGHPPAILYNDNSPGECKISFLRTPNIVIGGNGNFSFIKDTYKIYNGSTLYVFSDGVYEIEKKDGIMWRYNEFSNFIAKIKNEGQPVLNSLYNHVREIGMTDKLEDDFTIIEIVFS